MNIKYTEQWVKEGKETLLALMNLRDRGSAGLLYSYSWLIQESDYSYAEVQFLMGELRDEGQVTYLAVMEPKPKAPQGYWVLSSATNKEEKDAKKGKKTRYAG